MKDSATLAVVQVNDLERLIHTAVCRALEQYTPPASTPATPVEAITFDQARIALKVSAPTLRKLVRSGRLHAVQTGRRWLIPSGEIQRFLSGDRS